MTLRGGLDAAAAQQWLWIDEGTSALRDRFVADEVSVHGSSLIVGRVHAQAQGESCEGRDGRNGGVCSVGRSGREPVRLDLPYSSESRPEFIAGGVGGSVRAMEHRQPRSGCIGACRGRAPEVRSGAEGEPERAQLLDETRGRGGIGCVAFEELSERFRALVRVHVGGEVKSRDKMSSLLFLNLDDWLPEPYTRCDELGRCQCTFQQRIRSTRAPDRRFRARRTRCKATSTRCRSISTTRHRHAGPGRAVQDSRASNRA